MESFKHFMQDMISEKLITFGGQAYPKFGQVVILAGGAGCYPKGTEFFTGSGWKPIEEYKQGDYVLQFDPETDQTSLVDPDQFFDLPVDQFYQISNKRGSLTTSETHKHLTVNQKTGKYENLTTQDILEKHNTLSRGNKRNLVTSFQYNGGDGIVMTDAEIRLKVAVFADGHFLSTKEPKVRVSLKKERKIERMRVLIESVIGSSYREYEENGFTRFEFKYDTKDKEFESFWYDCNNWQLEVVRDEVLKWDGSVCEREDRKAITTFSSTSKKSVDFIQFAFASAGYDTRINLDVREDRNTCYALSINRENGNIDISKNLRAKTTTEVNEVDAGDRMYCFAVETGHFVVRQNNKIFVSGNSGKGFVLNNLVGIEGNTLDVDALKGLAIGSDRFAKKVKEETGQDLKDFDLSNPDNVAKLHELLSDVYGIVKANERRVFAGALAAPAERKPNLIFDVTLKDLGKLERITKNVKEIGYDDANIHIVWVVNDVDVALEQNRSRDRVVPEEILIATHEGVSTTMRKIVDEGDRVRRYMDGDIWFAFNKAGVDTDIKKSDLGGKYVDEANYIQIKKKGKKPLSLRDIGSKLLYKIAEYTPELKKWI